jgi:hypothetical protein
MKCLQKFIDLFITSTMKQTSSWRETVFKSPYFSLQWVYYVAKQHVYVQYSPHFTGLLFKRVPLNETTCKLFNNCSRNPFNTSPLFSLKQALNTLMSPDNADECEMAISQWLWIATTTAIIFTKLLGIISTDHGPLQGAIYCSFN